MTRSDNCRPPTLTRRTFVSATTASALAYGSACGDDGGSDAASGTTGSSGGSSGRDAEDGDDGLDDSGTADETGNGDASTGEPLPPGWAQIPDLTLMVGVPAEFDLGSLLTAPGDVTAISLDASLPDGLSLQDGVIAGTPTVAAAAMDYVATADGDETFVSDAFAISVVVGSEVAGLEFDRATPEQIAMHLPLQMMLPPDATATARYRQAGAREWQQAHPLLRITPDWVTGGAPTTPVDAFAGTIFGLQPGTSYELEISIASAGIDEVFPSAVTTRALPPEAGSATVNVAPGDDLQAAFDAMTPGTVVELADGTYEVSELSVAVAGTERMPIVVRGASRDGVVLRSDGRVLYLIETSHLIIENLTLQGTGVDSGTDASSQGIALWNGFVQENITIRSITMTGVDQGVVASGTVLSMLIYECILRGNNPWDAAFIESNLTWNDDGLRIPGEGNCAFNNTMAGFGDACAVQDGVFSAAVFFYRNRIEMTGDDACEGDYSTRNFAFYDNHVSNCATALSLDPVWGGPVYFFRNIIVNTTRGPFKLNNTNSGFMIYNNTIIRTNGLTDWAWAQPNNGALVGWSYRNNVLLFASEGNLLALESSGNDPVDFTNNAWFPDGSVWWTNSGGSYGSMQEARDGLEPTVPLFGESTERHADDVQLQAEPFVDPVPLGTDHLTEITALFVPTLADGSAAQGGGVAIANVTDGFSGAAPDIGAVIAGRSLPDWGAS